MVKTEKQIIQLLFEGNPLTLNEIAEKLGKKPKTVFRSLRKLFQKDKITCDPKTRRYSLYNRSP
ncbi:MAG: ArsR family transcriptional regulator [Candidatus Bathyarchaeota archaeon]|nr:MAG: ArsR family transcriptional regulator [Candidatus Bathyarchaeota archaeon]